MCAVYLIVPAWNLHVHPVQRLHLPCLSEKKRTSTRFVADCTRISNDTDTEDYTERSRPLNAYHTPCTLSVVIVPALQKRHACRHDRSLIYPCPQRQPYTHTLHLRTIPSFSPTPSLTCGFPLTFMAETLSRRGFSTISRRLHRVSRICKAFAFPQFDVI